jgi:hypothetical protein
MLCALDVLHKIARERRFWALIFGQGIRKNEENFCREMRGGPLAFARYRDENKGMEYSGYVYQGFHCPAGRFMA